MTALLKNSITIQPFGGMEVRLPTGETKVFPPRPPKTFVLSALLAAGRASDSLGASHAYRFADVKVGDQVRIDCSRVDGLDFCDHICIDRRSGGRVPPAPGDDHDTRFQWHNRCNALQDWEEFRIPVPDEFHPGGNQGAVAPMPHDPVQPRKTEVAPGLLVIPPAKP